MVRWLRILIGTVRAAICTHRELALENLALRQQLAVWKVRRPRPRLTAMDRIFWVILSRLWKSWRSSLRVVRPETVVGWHRQGFRRYWAWKSRRRRGRPRIAMELRDLIRRMSRANPLWGAPRIHGELLKLGLTVSQATVSKYIFRRRKPPSQTWRAFLKNHAKDLIAVDFFTVPTATFRILFVLVVLSHDRRRLVHFNVTEHPTAGWTARQLVEACGLEETPGHLIRDRDQVYGERFSRQARALNIREVVIAPRSPWQNAYAERIIGSIRRECLDHVVVIGERHLKRMLSEYVHYYNTTRTHLSLTKDAPEPRIAQPPSQGRVVEMPRVGGLHHEYLRRAA
jgi:transposase InsO family protein